MAIIQKPDVLSMLGNMKKFIVSSGSQISFELKEGNTVLLAATYEPGTDGRATIDVKDIIESRLKYNVLHTAIYEQTEVVKTFTAVIDGAPSNFKVIRAGVANLADTPSNWLRGNFLTWQPQNKKVTYHSPEWLTYYAQETCSLKLKAYFPDNTVQNINLGACEAGKAFTFNLQYALIAGTLGQNYPTHYEVWAENLSGTRLTYIQRYLYSDPLSELEQWFLFENSLGGLDTLRAYGDSDFTGNHEHKLSSVDDVLSEYDIDTERLYNKNTGFLDEYERKWLLDFFPSKGKYIYHSASIRPIVVKDSDVKYSASDLPSSYNFTYKFSDAQSAVLLNLIRSENIPDIIAIPNLETPDFLLPPRLAEFPSAELHEGVIIPAFDPHSDQARITTFGHILAITISETLAKIQAGEGGGELVNVLRSTSSVPASDYSVFSSLKTQLAIQEAIIPIIHNYIPKSDIITSDDDTAVSDTKILSALKTVLKITEFSNSLYNTIKDEFLQKSDIITSDDEETEPTDENVLSSARVLQEIENFVEILIPEIDSRYLRKDVEDTAREVITFLKGIIAADTSEFTDLIASGKITAENIDVTNHLLTNTLKVILQADLQTILLRGQMNSEAFVSGFLGNGMRLANINGKWVLELDNLVVRKTMEIFELVVQRIRYQGGQVIHSPAGAKLTVVTDNGSHWRCEHDGTVDFITDAQVLCQNFNVGSRKDNPDGSSTFNGATVKRYWRRVTSYGSGYFNLSKADCEEGSSIPEVNDEVVVLGHRNNPDWQNAILIASTGGNTPYIAHYAGISSYSLEGKEVVRDGNLEGVVDSDFGQLYGYGLYSNNVYLKGIFRLLSGVRIDEALTTLGGAISAVATDLQTEVSALPGKIKLEVSKSRVGGKNFLRNYDTRFGTDYWGGSVALVDEEGELIPVLVVSVTAPYPVTVFIGAEPELPTTIKLNLDSGSSVDVPVEWGNIDTSIAGELSIEGTYQLPNGVTGDMPEVFLTVYVVALTVVSVTPLSQVTVNQYASSVPMPTTIQLNLNDGTSRDVPVSWSFNPDIAGTFQITGIYELPYDISGYKPTVKITLVINEVVDNGTFINVKPILLSSLTNAGTPTGWLLQSDDRGEYVLSNNSTPSVTDLNQHITSTSKLYMDIAAAGATSGFGVFVFYSSGSPSFSSYYPDRTGKHTINLGTSRAISRIEIALSASKIYRMELRNDGTIPPWY